MSFPGAFPPEVLLVVFKHLLHDEPSFATLPPALAALYAVCLSSKAFSEMATALLFRHVLLADRDRLETFVLGTVSEDPVTGEARFNRRKGVESIFFKPKYKDLEDDSSLIECLVEVVDVAAVERVAIADAVFDLHDLEPFTSKSLLHSRAPLSWLFPTDQNPCPPSLQTCVCSSCHT